jgi:hypothetical protein
MQLVPYQPEYKSCWDTFVAQSKNATFLFFRDYMDYHADRFHDHSLMFYKKDRLLGLLPGNVEEDVYYSHQGLTYGGNPVPKRLACWYDHLLSATNFPVF